VEAVGNMECIPFLAASCPGLGGPISTVAVVDIDSRGQDCSSRARVGRSAMGHEDAFPRPRLSARCAFSKKTFAGTGSYGEDAPIADLPFLLLVMESAEAEPFQSTGTRLA